MHAVQESELPHPQEQEDQGAFEFEKALQDVQENHDTQGNQITPKKMCHPHIFFYPFSDNLRAVPRTRGI
jgi:hypothetical protein